MKSACRKASFRRSASSGARRVAALPRGLDAHERQRRLEPAHDRRNAAALIRRPRRERLGRHIPPERRRENACHSGTHVRVERLGRARLRPAPAACRRARTASPRGAPRRLAVERRVRRAVHDVARQPRHRVVQRLRRRRSTCAAPTRRAPSSPARDSAIGRRRRTRPPCAAPTPRSRRHPSARRDAGAAAGRRASSSGRRSRPAETRAGSRRCRAARRRGTAARPPSDRSATGVMNVPRASCTARRGKVTAGRGERRLAQVAVNDAQARVRGRRTRTRPTRAARRSPPRPPAAPGPTTNGSGRRPLAEVGQAPGRDGLLERPVDPELHRHVPVHVQQTPEWRHR